MAWQKQTSKQINMFMALDIFCELQRAWSRKMFSTFRKSCPLIGQIEKTSSSKCKH